MGTNYQAAGVGDFHEAGVWVFFSVERISRIEIRVSIECMVKAEEVISMYYTHELERVEATAVIFCASQSNALVSTHLGIPSVPFFGY